jgi:Ankyrin repeats (3 copies)/Ankyrin repeat
MPTELPPHPDLEFLKKQAKALLQDFRQGDPDASEKFTSLPLKTPPKLSDAQHWIAREYGFDSWRELKKQVELLSENIDDPLKLARKAFLEDDAGTVGRLLKRYPQLRAKINEPVADFDSPAITQVKSRSMLDVVLEAGADINAKSRWWAGGFGLLDCASPELAVYAIQRGAELTVHAAARLGMLERLKQLLTTNPELVQARGGDGQTPLHFSSTIEITDYILDKGAEIDARDVDHESTPAQYMVRSRPEIARHLIRRGCKTDILMASALGDADLVCRHLDADPECIRMRISDEYFPMVDGEKGGTIYQWELGWYVSAPQVAQSFGHPDLFRLLMERSPADEKLLNACWLHDQGMVESLLAQNSALAASLSPAGRRHLAHGARNNDLPAVRLMLVAGLPVDAVSQHHATALHWAAWHGNAEMVQLIVPHHPDLENAVNDYKSKPIGWAIHGSENGWHRQFGDYGATVETLLEAGARLPESVQGSKEVRATLREHGIV